MGLKLVSNPLGTCSAVIVFDGARLRCTDYNVHLNLVSLGVDEALFGNSLEHFGIYLNIRLQKCFKISISGGSSPTTNSKIFGNDCVDQSLVTCSLKVKKQN